MDAIPVSDATQTWAETRVARGDYPSVSAYVDDLAAQDRERQEGIAALKALLDEAERSGYCDEPVEKLFDDVRARLA